MTPLLAAMNPFTSWPYWEWVEAFWWFICGFIGGLMTAVLLYVVLRSWARRRLLSKLQGDEEQPK